MTRCRPALTGRTVGRAGVTSAVCIAAVVTSMLIGCRRRHRLIIAAAEAAILTTANVTHRAHMSCLLRHVRGAVQRVSLIVIPGCLCVCRSFRDLQPTTMYRSQPNLVGRYILVLAPV